MKISIDELRALPQQKLNLSFRENIDDLNAVKPVLGELTVSAGATGIKLFGTVQTLLKLTCHRCLRPYFLNLSVPVEESFIEHRRQDDFERSGKISREKELTAQDFIEELPEDGVLDITDLVYQAVTLATPVSCLCGDSCPGPAFPDAESLSGSLADTKDDKESQEKIDPRWKNLKTLFADDESGEKS